MYLSWSMDFMSDSLTKGRRIRVLNIIHDYNRELWLAAQFSYPGDFVVRFNSLFREAILDAYLFETKKLHLLKQ